MDYLSPLETLFPGVGASMLSVLSRTSQPLTIRQIAERAHASHPQVSRHIDRFEALGVVQRRIAGRSHLVTLTHSAAADLIRRFTELQAEVIAHMRASAALLEPAPDSIVVFGSFARGTARADSDIVVVVVAPPGCSNDDAWLEGLSSWVEKVAAYAGNPVAEILVSREELDERQADPLWDRIRSEGTLIAGAELAELTETVRQDAGSGAP